ncbi:hypothetical protein G3I21_07520 [Streptomyces bauhiniae]|uniref:Uncharacterized protein n=1 Tax=Streptomyces bauhiniae TaxID=2340725 RepID=A0A7K3QNT0_9ACTN|nr:hypothetical protein [Streptomyces bauhiniae]
MDGKWGTSASVALLGAAHSSAAWMVPWRYSSGNSTISQRPLAALYSGSPISYRWYRSVPKR